MVKALQLTTLNTTYIQEIWWKQDRSENRPCRGGRDTHQY